VHQRFGTHEDVYWRTAAQDAYGAGILALVAWLQIEGVDVATTRALLQRSGKSG